MYSFNKLAGSLGLKTQIMLYLFICINQIQLETHPSKLIKSSISIFFGEESPSPSFVLTRAPENCEVGLLVLSSGWLLLWGSVGSTGLCRPLARGILSGSLSPSVSSLVLGDLHWALQIHGLGRFLLNVHRQPHLPGAGSPRLCQLHGPAPEPHSEPAPTTNLPSAPFPGTCS